MAEENANFGEMGGGSSGRSKNFIADSAIWLRTKIVGRNPFMGDSVLQHNAE